MPRLPQATPDLAQQPRPSLGHLLHVLHVVVDRLVIRDGIEQRLADSFETALGLADGIAVVEMADAKKGKDPERLIFSEKFACPVSGFTIDDDW